MNNKTGSIVGWILTGLVSFLASGLFKLFGGEKTIEMANSLGGSQHLVVLGILEIVMVALFLIRRTAIVGFLLMVAYMGGAITVHFTTNQALGVVIGIETLIWITGAIRFPELTRRLVNTAS